MPQRIVEQRLARFAQKFRHPVFGVKAVRKIHRLRALGQKRRLRHVQDAAARLAQFFQRQRRLARAGRPHQHQRRRAAIYGLLRIVKAELLVEHMNLATSGYR